MFRLDVMDLKKLRTVRKTNTLHDLLFLSNVTHFSFGSKRSMHYIRLTEIKVRENGAGNKHDPVHTSTSKFTW